MIPKFCVLLSYAYASPVCVKNLMELHALGVEIMVDSGAFSIARAGKTVDLADYIAFCKDLPKTTYGYVQLDVVGDAKRSHENLRVMQDAGTNPMAVLTVDMPESEIVGLTELNDKVCIAGGVTMAPEAVSARLLRLSRIAPDMKAHALGFTRSNYPQRSKAASVDSSSWCSSSRYGSLSVFAPHHGIRNYARTAFRSKKMSEIPKDVADWIVAHGLRMEDFRHQNTAYDAPLAVASGVAWAEYAAHMRSVGKRFFWAVSSNWEFQAACLFNYLYATRALEAERLTDTLARIGASWRDPGVLLEYAKAALE